MPTTFRPTLPFLLLVSVAFFAGCKVETSQGSGIFDTDGLGGPSGSTTGIPGPGSNDGPTEGSTSHDGGSGDSDGDETGDPVEPHALGMIELSEWHNSDGTQITPGATAVFIPDAAQQAASCTQTVEGCTIALIPECDPQCGEDEYCSFDANCQSTCAPVCDAQCWPGEVCYFPTPGQAACRKIEDFDAGALTFGGTTVQLTLLPPYSFQGKDTGSLFTPGAQLSISASGAAMAGFEAFEDSFAATQILQTYLEDVTRAQAFGLGPLPVRWVAGDEDVIVSATVIAPEGQHGRLQCEASDPAGQFDIPRSAILAAIGGADPSNLSLMVQRSRTELKKGFATKGMLSSAVVQPAGWLQLRTASSESHQFEGCGSHTACGDACVDTSDDPQNCGGCGIECSGTQPCQNGTCGCAASQFTCDTGQCIPLNYVCDDDSDCGDGSDEDDCGCTPQQFACNNGSCVAQSDVCDDQNDCGDGSDEVGCNSGSWTCDPGFFGTNDGCDCGCGVVDPDCSSASSSACEYCSNTGSCNPPNAGCPGEIDPSNNATCG